MPRLERPYAQFSFRVSWNDDAPQAGFQEVSGLGLEITVAEYRAGSDPTNAPKKLTGMYKVPDITLKRGVVAAPELNNWLALVKNGQQDMLRQVTIELMDEQREN